MHLGGSGNNKTMKSNAGEKPTMPHGQEDTPKSTNVTHYVESGAAKGYICERRSVARPLWSHKEGTAKAEDQDPG